MIPAIGCLVLLALVCAAFDVTFIVTILFGVVICLMGVVLLISVLVLFLPFAIFLLLIVAVGWLILKALP